MRTFLKSFRRNKEGGVTIEFVLWIPVFITIMAITADTSFIFMKQANYWEIARDTARIVARHGMTADAAKSYAENSAISAGSEAKTLEDGSTETVNYPVATVTVGTNTVTVTVSAPASKLMMFGTLGTFLTNDITASVTHALEPR